MANINVAGLIKEADQAIRDRAALTEKVAGLRELLRYSVKAGEANEEQATWILEAFPPRQRGEQVENGDGE
jgi:hypothetical protein